MENNLKEIIDLIKEKFPNSNPKKDKSRGKPLHIRVTRNLKVKDFLDKMNFNLISKEKHTAYSKSYNTIFILYKGKNCPIVISDNQEKTTSDSIVQKSLTPQKLKISGDFENSKILADQIKFALSKIKKDLTLNKLAKEQIADEKDEKLFLLLNKLIDMVLDENLIMTDEESLIFEINKASICKDFGECLSALKVLNETDTKKIKISSSESSNNFDILSELNDGLCYKINVKSGTGSGQSMKNFFSESQIESLNKDQGYSPDSIYDIYSNVITILCSKEKMGGYERILKVANEFSKIDDNLGSLLLDIKNIFFNNKEFNLKNLVKKDFNFDFYKNNIMDILKSKNLKIVGIPTGSKNAPADVFFEENEDSLEKIIIFTISTFIDKFHNQEKFNYIVENLIVNPIKIMHVSGKNGILRFSKPKRLSYKIHYWAHFKSPTNNMLGLKAIFSNK